MVSNNNKLVVGSASVNSKHLEATGSSVARRVHNDILRKIVAVGCQKLPQDVAVYHATHEFWLAV